MIYYEYIVLKIYENNMNRFCNLTVREETSKRQNAIMISISEILTTNKCLILTVNLR